MPSHFTQISQIAAPVQAVFAWHQRQAALERLTPPWETVSVSHRSGGIEPGGEVILKNRLGPLTLKWHVQHVQPYQPNQVFSDRQISGPFKTWLHQHVFSPLTERTSELRDDMQYTLPFGVLGQWFGGAFVRRKLSRLFRYRHTITQNDLAMFHKYHQSGEHPMKILVSGSSGLVGSNLVTFLKAQGEDVFTLVRRAPQNDHEIAWNPDQQTIEQAKLEGLDAVIHLAGENIVGLWTAAKKQRIQDSRVNGTQFLSGVLAKLQNKPKVLVSASAIGYYGNRGDTLLSETEKPANDFLGQTCQAWESATQLAQASGIRTVNARLGIILTSKGGALQKMLPAFLLGGGGRLGSGKQYMSWIALDDVLGGLYHALKTDSITGPMNLVAPHPVDNQTYTKTLGKVLFRPTIAPVPAFAVKLLFGEMGETLFLHSTRVKPSVLEQTGYSFLFPQLEGALRHLLGK